MESGKSRCFLQAQIIRKRKREGVHKEKYVHIYIKEETPVYTEM